MSLIYQVIFVQRQQDIGNSGIFLIYRYLIVFSSQLLVIRN